jgi:hypothetical protein
VKNDLSAAIERYFGIKTQKTEDNATQLTSTVNRKSHRHRDAE